MMQATETCSGSDAMGGCQAMSREKRLACWVARKFGVQRGMWSFELRKNSCRREFQAVMVA